jgi:hypothetical protein
MTMPDEQLHSRAALVMTEVNGLSGKLKELPSQAIPKRLLPRKARSAQVFFRASPGQDGIERFEKTLSQIWNLDRYALEYGPILMAFVGPLEGGGPSMRQIVIYHRPQDLKNWLVAKPNEPLHYSIRGYPQYESMPYWQVGDQPFTCFPNIQPQ